jgi:hypothetical protein
MTTLIIVKDIYNPTMNINWNGFIVNAIVVMFLVLIVNVILHVIVVFHFTIIIANGVFYDYNSDGQWFCDSHYWWPYFTIVKYIPTYLLPTYFIYGFKRKTIDKVCR